LSPAPLPREHPDAPKYWKDEVSGRLAAAVRSYLDNPDAMTLREITYIRAYVSQWIQSPVWDMNPHADADSRAGLAVLRAGVGAITNARDIAAWIRAATEAGLDPL
jgi:hypothetical protein